MAREILMPALSPTMEDGTLARWLVKEGDAVSPGDIIAEIESDKTVFEFEAMSAGRLGRILVAAGSTGVRVNTPIALLDEAGARASAPKDPPPPLAPANSRPAREAQADAALAPDTAMRKATVREALREAIMEEMRRDENVFVMGVDVADQQGGYKITQGLRDAFGPRRVIDTPVSEQGFAGVGIGAALAGLRPVVEFRSFSLALQAMDQIVNSAAKAHYISGGAISCPIVFRGPAGAAARAGAQHSQDLAAWFAHVPGLKVVQPYSAADSKGLLKSAIRDPGPVVFLENESLYGRSFDLPDLEDYTVPLGKARIARPGRDVTIVSFGIGMTHALEAAEALAGDGIEAEVIDLRCLRPLDTETVIDSVKRTNRCVTVEEGPPVCAIGSEISSALMRHAFDWLDAPVVTCTGKDVPMPYAANLEQSAMVSAQDVIEAVRAVTYR